MKSQADIDLSHDNELKDLRSQSKLVTKDVEIAKLTAEKALLKNQLSEKPGTLNEEDQKKENTADIGSLKQLDEQQAKDKLDIADDKSIIN